MKSSSVVVFLSGVVVSLALCASAREMVLPAGTLLKCTLNEPNFSSATASVGDPVLCHLHSQTEFGKQAFPRGSYLVGHLESDKDPGHFWGKGNLKLVFDRIGLPDGDVPLEAKVIATRGYRVDREGEIVGKGHAKRDIVEWMLPPLWPWKVIMLPARGPRPTLKNETALTLRLMDDVQIPQVATLGPGWHFFGHPENESFRGAVDPAGPQVASQSVMPVAASEPRLEEVAQDVDAVPATARYALASTRVSGITPGVPVFVLKSGTLLEVSNYTYQTGRIRYELASGGTGVISTDEVDWTTTTQVNSRRGVRVTLRGGHPAGSEGGF
jgi:hypothetical protein